MQAITVKETINVGDKTFYHYSLGGKWFSKEFVVINGVTYYDSVKGEETFITT